MSVLRDRGNWLVHITTPDPSLAVWLCLQHFYSITLVHIHNHVLLPGVVGRVFSELHIAHIELVAYQFAPFRGVTTTTIAFRSSFMISFALILP